jgi:hypothetical protein
MWLVTLVDVRYWWWYKAAQIEVTSSSEPWATFIAAIASALGATITVPTVPAAYLNPPTDLTVRNDPLPIVLDAAAYSIGMRLVANLDGTFKLQGGQAAIDAFNPQLANHRIVAGGPISLFPVTSSFNAANPDNDVFESLPNAVNVAFPITRHTFPNCPPYVSNQPLSGLTVAPLSQIKNVTLNGVKPFRSTAAPGYNTTGTLLNKTELDTLAAQIATDFYLWQLGPNDTQFSGAVNYTPEGLHDIEWTHPGAATILTRVQRMPWNDQVTDLQHSGTYGSNVVADIVADVKANASSKTGNYFDALLVTFTDPPVYTNRQPAWLHDPSGSSTTTSGRVFPGCTLVGSHGGRPVYDLPGGGGGGGGGGLLTVFDVETQLTVPNVNALNIYYGEVNDGSPGANPDFAILSYSGQALSLDNSVPGGNVPSPMGQIVWYQNNIAGAQCLYWQSFNFSQFNPPVATQNAHILPCGGLYMGSCWVVVTDLGSMNATYDLSLVATGVNGGAQQFANVQITASNFAFLTITGLVFVPPSSPPPQMWAVVTGGGSGALVTAGRFTVAKLG